MPLAVKIGSPDFRRKAVGWLPIPAAHKLRDAIDIMEDESKRIVDAKRTTTSGPKEECESGLSTNGKDIMSVLCEFWIHCWPSFEVKPESVK